MMTLRQFYLTKLMEECAEVAQRAAKSMQFGAEEIQTGQELTNRVRLSEELNDLLTVMDTLQYMDEVTIESIGQFQAYYFRKNIKIQEYLRYSQKLGMVENE